MSALMIFEGPIVQFMTLNKWKKEIVNHKTWNLLNNRFFILQHKSGLVCHSLQRLVSCYTAYLNISLHF